MGYFICPSYYFIYIFSIKERTESTTDASIEVVSAESVRLAAVLAALMEEQSSGSKRKGLYMRFTVILTITILLEGVK